LPEFFATWSSHRPYAAPAWYIFDRSAAALCADNSVTDCVIAAAGAADAVTVGDGETTGSAPTALTQINITNA
jgi:hypothetical protein